MSKFLENVKARWKHFSSIALATGASIQGAWVAFPDDLKTELGTGTAAFVSKLTAIILLWGFVGKFIDQPPKEKQE